MDITAYHDRIPFDVLDTVDRIRAKVAARRSDAEANRTSGKWLTEFGAIEGEDCWAAFSGGVVWSADSGLPLLVGPGIWGAGRSIPAKAGATVLRDPESLTEKRFDETPLWGGKEAHGFCLIGGKDGARDEASRRHGNIYKVFGDDVFIVDTLAQYVKGIVCFLNGRDVYSSVSCIYHHPEGGGGNRIHGGPFLVERSDMNSSDDCNQCWLNSDATDDLIGAFVDFTSRPQQGSGMAVYNLSPEYDARVWFANGLCPLERDPAVVRQRVMAAKLIATGGGDIHAYVSASQFLMTLDKSDKPTISLMPMLGDVHLHLMDTVVHRPLMQAISVDALRDEEINGRAFITIDGGRYTRPRTPGVPTISRRSRDVLAMTGRPVVRGRVEVR